MSRLLTLFLFCALITPAIATEESRRETLEALRKEASNGSADAQAKLGTIYFYGHLGQKPDHALAVHWFEKAAAQNVASAQLNLAICYDRGLGVQKDQQKAMSFYKPAADQGLLPAIINVAFAYQKLGEVKMAGKYFKEGADRGNRHCQREYAKLLLTDEFGLPDPLRAKGYLEQAVKTGDPLASLALADLYSGKFPEIRPDAAKMFNLLLKAAESDNPEALSKIGYCYEEGIGVPRSTDQAVGWYKRAAERGHAPAMVNLADCYRDGRGAPRNPDLAYSWYKVAADQAYVMGIFNLGVCYAVGLGAKESLPQARNYFKAAADKELPIAQFNYGVYLQEGRGGDRDTVAAAHWFKKAADAGFPKAMSALAECYEQGLGVTRDLDAAKLWRRKAIAAKATK
jgi:TPR repeat protein